MIRGSNNLAGLNISYNIYNIYYIHYIHYS